MIKELKSIKVISSILISMSVMGLHINIYKGNLKTGFCLPAIAQEIGDITDKVCKIENPKIFHDDQPPWDVNCIATKKCVWEEYVEKKFYICPEGYTQYLVDGNWGQKIIICKENANPSNIIPPTIIKKLEWAPRNSYESVEVSGMCGDLSKVKNKYKPEQCPKVKIKFNGFPNMRIKAKYKCNL